MAQKITPCLWFDSEAEEAARFYVSVFRNARSARSAVTARKVLKSMAGLTVSVMTVEFEIEGQNFTALNGGPHFKFNEAISFQIPCETQQEIDHYWSNSLRVAKSRMRLAQGQVRRVLADLPGRFAGYAE